MSARDEGVAHWLRRKAGEARDAIAAARGGA
jgi:hypothetical protein